MEMEGDTETFDVSSFICFGGVGAVDMLCVGGTCCGSDLGVATNGMRGTGEKNSGRGDLGRWDWDELLFVGFTAAIPLQACMTC